VQWWENRVWGKLPPLAARSYVSNIKRKLIFSFFKSAVKLMTHDTSRLKWATDESVITLHAKMSPTIVLITSHFVQFRKNSAEMTKFRGRGQIPHLRSKFRGTRKTEGPNNGSQIYHDLTFQGHVKSSVTWLTDPPYAISYWCPIGTESLSSTVFEIFASEYISMSRPWRF